MEHDLFGKPLSDLRQRGSSDQDHAPVKTSSLDLLLHPQRSFPLGA
jgi:hypothetical protein